MKKFLEFKELVVFSFSLFLFSSLLISCLTNTEFVDINDGMFINRFSGVELHFKDSILLVDGSYFQFSQNHLKIIKLINQYDPQGVSDLISWQQKKGDPKQFLGVDLIYLIEGNIDTYLRNQITKKYLKGNFLLDQDFSYTKRLREQSILKYNAFLLNGENHVLAFGDPLNNKFTMKIFQSIINANK